MKFIKGNPPWNKGLKGKPLSDETKKKLSDIKKGKPPNNKGKHYKMKKGVVRIRNPHREETKQKISNSKKGCVPWIKDKKHSDKTRQLISLMKTGRSRKGVPHSIETRIKISNKRNNQIFPFKNTSIENIIEYELLKNNIQYEQHKSFKIRNSNHQVDFFIKPNIIIECDGDYWHSKINRLFRDNIIDYELEKQGLKVIRLREYDIHNNISWCINLIKLTLKQTAGTGRTYDYKVYEI